LVHPELVAEVKFPTWTEVRREVSHAKPRNAETLSHREKTTGSQPGRPF
jgi:hypothetical protein